MMKRAIFIISIVLTTYCGAAVIGFDADDFADYENMHTPIPELTLWRLDYREQFDIKYNKIFAVPSTDNLLGERSIGWLLSPAEGYHEWWDEEPSLYITLNGGLAKSITIDTAFRPNWIKKTIVVDCWDSEGNQVAHNFTMSNVLTTNVGEYTISSVCIWTVGQRSIDNISLEYIPEPATVLILGLGVTFLRIRRV